MTTVPRNRKEYGAVEVNVIQILRICDRGGRSRGERNMKKLRTRVLMFMAAIAAAAACHPAWAEDNGNTALTKDVKILYRIYRKKTPSDAI